MQQILALTGGESGLHFHATTATAEQVAAFSLDDIAARTRRLAPDVWSLLDGLLAADPRAVERRLTAGKATARRARERKRRPKAVDLDGDEEMQGDMAELEERSDSEEERRREAPETPGGPSLRDLAEERYQALVTIKKVVCISIMAQSTNQRCNTLQSIVGIFLHSAGTPETVVELMSRLGISLTTTSINNAVSSLSSESVTVIQQVGRTLLAAYAYDNVDIDLKHAMPTGDVLHDTLVHLTSGTLLQLDHGVTREMLACSELLWKKSKHNPKGLASDIPPTTDYIRLLDIHPEADDHPSGLLRRERFNLWVFLRDLVMHGPQYFRKFRLNLPQPESINPIPLVKSRQVPARMMDINPSTNAMNATVLEDLFKQGGVGDPLERSGVTNLGDHVVLVHGDLLTGERINSLQETRSEEATPWRRFQFVVYVLGLFHFKMACADAIWRIFIQSKQSRNCVNSQAPLWF
ncbi:hypothetical protein FIBSPDRAFT_964223 [Athelia psychrophila]|uniref:DUF6589 domain-containing protein n=1 Tax=Athelia psychrophila TaxID=1759441 RepID=A0A165Y1N6_9AGAM|nr:hypothetical protein FIBSPDRAFT_964223 [Fibularhizoctonia sp. CBS 109695]